LNSSLAQSPGELLSCKLFKFCKKSGTRGTERVNDLQNFLTQNADNGLVTCAVFLHLAKAFDTVNHDIVLYKLNTQYGKKHLPLLLLRNYLENCPHCVL